MKILAIIVTYYPDKDLLMSNIDSFIDYVDDILVWENTPDSEKMDFRIISHKKIQYCGDGTNSISHALNYAWKYAKKNEYHYILIMDQDSLFENFEKYIERTVKSQYVPEGIWGPSLSKDYPNHPQVEEVNSVINSGTLVKTDIVNKIGGWNESFEIDGVDDEFCLRAKQIGICSYRINDCYLKQRYGTPKIVSFLGKKVLLRNDSPERLYGIYKNFTILSRMYPEAKGFRTEYIKVWIKGQMKWIVMFETHRIKKLSSILRGIFDGMTCRIDKM